MPTSAVYLEEKDTHGGFVGDGEYFAKIQLSPKYGEVFLGKAIEKGTWSNLPIIKSYDYEFNNEDYIGLEEKNLRIPNDIKRGDLFFSR